MNRPVIYYQTDPRWKGRDYSARGESTTIGASGCGPTCAAMVIETVTGRTFTPADACVWALRHGYKCPGSGTYYSYFAAQGRAYGLVWEQINHTDLRKMKAAAARKLHDMALEAVRAGDMVIACMGPGNWTKGGHYILWYGLDGEDALINDPASAKPARTRNKVALLQKQVKYYFICRTPAGKEEPEVTEEQVKALIAQALQEQKEAQWYPTLADVPEWYRPSVKKLMDKGILKGSDGGKDGRIETVEDNTLRVDETFCRIITLLDRAGVI